MFRHDGKGQTLNGSPQRKAFGEQSLMLNVVPVFAHGRCGGIIIVIFILIWIVIGRMIGRMMIMIVVVVVGFIIVMVTTRRPQQPRLTQIGHGQGDERGLNQEIKGHFGSHDLYPASRSKPHGITMIKDIFVYHALIQGSVQDKGQVAFDIQ